MPYDPKKELSSHTEKPARRAVLITPADTDLDVYARSLRIYNDGTAGDTVRVTYVDEPLDTDFVELKCPLGLTIEPSAVRRVWATGTDAASFTIHGYTK